MKYFQAARKYGSRVATGAAVALMTAAPAFAELPTEVSTQMAETKTDAATMGGLGLVIVIAIAAFKYLRSAK
ncbi:major capsid protein [Pseudaeromonas paramecii]|uniref:Uncharacterized protein n=1 Tax=Pseudaeromonas paramecii TaxID=2138166 RepID=A0ABP8PVY0_9GAMM